MRTQSDLPEINEVCEEGLNTNSMVIKPKHKDEKSLQNKEDDNIFTKLKDSILKTIRPKN